MLGTHSLTFCYGAPGYGAMACVDGELGRQVSWTKCLCIYVIHVYIRYKLYAYRRAPFNGLQCMEKIYLRVRDLCVMKPLLLLKKSVCVNISKK